MSMFKNDKISASGRGCGCKDNGLYFNARQASWVVVIAIMLGFFIFITGYFWGKRNGAQELSFVASQESLTDQVYSSLCVMNDEDVSYGPATPENTVVHEQDSLSKGGDANVEQNEVPIILSDTKNEPVEVGQIPVASAIMSNHTYCAQLVGFGTKRAADRFVARMDRHRIPVVIVTKHSKTTKGVARTWYQAMTNTFSDKAQLEKQIEQIKTIERLHDVRIITI